MMNAKALAILVLFLGIAFPASAQRIISDMTPTSIADAIKAGERGDVADGALTQSSGFSWGSTRIASFSTPYMRVAAAARQAKRNYQKFTTDSVTPEMIAPELHVYAVAQGGGKGRAGNNFDRNQNDPFASSVTTVVITPRKGSDSDKQSKALHPLRFEPISTLFANIFGWQSEGAGMMAVFPLDALSEDNEVHVVYNKEVTVGVNGVGGRHCEDCHASFNLKGVR